MTVLKRNSQLVCECSVVGYGMRLDFDLISKIAQSKTWRCMIMWVVTIHSVFSSRPGGPCRGCSPSGSNTFCLLSRSLVMVRKNLTSSKDLCERVKTYSAVWDSSLWCLDILQRPLNVTTTSFPLGKGTETLPRGIVESTTDLELRHLWLFTEKVR